MEDLNVDVNLADIVVQFNTFNPYRTPIPPRILLTWKTLPPATLWSKRPKKCRNRLKLPPLPVPYSQSSTGPSTLILTSSSLPSDSSAASTPPLTI